MSFVFDKLTRLQIRPAVFCMAQVIAYALRAAIAAGSTSTTLYEVRTLTH